MKMHDLIQGTDAWHQFRLEHYGASEAAAMLGMSKHLRRSELLHAKKTGTPREFSAWFQAYVLDRGHEVEALARPIVEQHLDDTLYPVTCSDGKLSASCDGLTLDGVAFECKQHNAALFAGVQAGLVPDEHMPQCQQIMLVTGAKRVLFTVSDGTPAGTVWTEVLPDPAWFERIRQGWALFEIDLAAYVPQPKADPVVATVETLPAVSVRMDGALSVVSNLDRFGVALRAFVERIPAKPATDQEFADCEAACKALKAAEDQLEAQESGALASIASVEEMRRVVAELKDVARTTRLASEKLVQRRKDEIKADAIAGARLAFDKHIAELNREIAPVTLVLPLPDFAAAAKGKRTVTTLKDAVDSELARAKIAASTAATAMRAKLAWYREHAAGHEFLFADLQGLAQRPTEDFQQLVLARITTHQAKEAEKARVATEAAEHARLAAEAAAVLPVQAPPQPQPAPVPAPAIVPIPQPAATEEATLKLGDINVRLNFVVTADFVERILGVAGKADGRSRLFTENQYRLICHRLIQRLQRELANERAAA